jgi:hypothetical protein
MQEYDVKKGHFKNLAGDGLKNIVNEIFGFASDEEGKIVTSFGAIKKLTVWTEAGKLYAHTDMDTTADSETASSTIKAWNNFLERATGYTSTERRKRLQKLVKEGKL